MLVRSMASVQYQWVRASPRQDPDSFLWPAGRSAVIERILVPLDGSASAETGIPYAVALHRAFGSEIVLFRVVEAAPNRPGLFSESMGWRLAEAEGQSYLTKITGKLRDEGIEVRTDVAAGNAASEILDAIRRWDAELVVLTSHGSGSASAFSCGGTASKVISTADTSFLLLRTNPGEEPPEKSLERIVVPVDGSPRSEWALNLAAQIARSSSLELALVHVVARPELLHGAAASPQSGRLAEQLIETNRAAGLRYLDQKKRQLSSPELRVSTRVAVASSVPRAIHGLAFREKGSLLVLSAHGRTPGSGWTYGGTASALLSQSTGPILVFQDLPRREPGRSDHRGRYARTPARSGGLWSE